MVSMVACWPNVPLQERTVHVEDGQSRNQILELASSHLNKTLVVAIVLVFNSIVRGSNRYKISYCHLSFTRFYNVPSDEGSLGQANYVEFLFAKNRVRFYLFASFLSLIVDGGV
jgi:hypothetical protein